ncbi:MAG: transglycosylase SLT domain-containing protein [Pseudomonadota bacterium]
MIPWLWGIVLCLGLLAGCGGPNGSLVHVDPYPTASLAESDELLGEELSSKRLEELYAKSGIPGWDPSLEAELRKWEHQVKFDVPIQMNKQVKAYLVYFSTERKAVIQRYLVRSTRYLPLIKETFQEYGLPEDLAYLAMIESGFNPNAYSHAGACGMWQFIKGTGLRYGLVIDGQVDERRDPVKSTRAAAKYLSDLYKQFGSWYLAAASYNCGERRVERELRKNHHRNFWELSANRCLPTETKNYVPQMIAATIIAKNPERFGFSRVPYEPPLSPADKVQLAQAATVTVRPGMGNQVVAARPAPLPQKGRESSYSQAQGKSTGRVSVARQADAKSRTPDKNPKKPETRVAQAKGSKRQADHAYTASLLGSPSAATNKDRAGKNKAARPGSVTAQKKKSNHRVISKSKDRSPALFARRGEAKYAKAKIRQKSSPGKKDVKQVRTKSKPLVVSELR